MSYTREEATQHKKRLLPVTAVSLALFLFLLYEVLTEGTLLELDAWISQHVPHLQSQALTEWVIRVTDMNGIVGSAVFSLLLSAYLLYEKNRKALLFYWIAYLGGSALFTGIKYAVERTRPLLKIVDEQGLSFPSGHSTMSMVMALSLYFIFVSRLERQSMRYLLLALTVLWPVLIVLTRIYLNVHWFTDTLAGLSLGVFWVTLLVIFFPLERKK